MDLERKLNSEFPSDQKYSHENRGTVLVKAYSEEYSTAYHDLMNGMVERRLTSSIISVGSYWYTAWVNAGQPNLNDLLDGEPSKKLQEANLELEKSYRGSKIKGREHSD